MTDAEAIDAIIEREGDYSEHPDDRGGATRWGVTLATLSAWRGTPQTPDDVKALTKDEARAIYFKRYLTEPGIGKIADDTLRALVLDGAVNHGPRAAIKHLQHALGIKEDGVMGPVTLLALPHLSSRTLAVKLLAERGRYYGSIITADPKQAVFAHGWMNRLGDLLDDVA